MKTVTTNLEDETIKTLYNASLNDSVTTLNTLIQNNPLILHKVSLSPYNETPLHISSLLGHLEFCEVLLKNKPSFTNEVDSKGRCPLHLASAEGHTQVVKALLLANQDVCLVSDKDEMIPLHFAVIRGRMGVIKELINARPDSVRVLNDDGSVLHLCVLYNHLESLKFLLESIRGDKQLLLAKDREGNTILHLAIRLKQIKTIKYLLLQPEIRTTTITLSRSSFTTLELLEPCPRDFINLKIEEMLTEVGVQRSKQMESTLQHTPLPSISNQELPNGRRKMWENLWFKYLQFQGNWIEETRGTLMLVATVIATMTFQSTISPPGGVWQEDTHTGGRNCTTYGVCEAGTAVLAYAWPNKFIKFMAYNTTSFFSSLGVVLLLISGFPLKNKVMMWILTMAMTIAYYSTGLGHSLSYYSTGYQHGLPS
ncbi:ankyrin repeat-containing protein BDA1-like [Vicia villosa]|uniref:ankyrin repeat-containing protein BDA1-like n=1 Tax=Vicia villosa TaxID=3911 RepID=UPI00273B959A|nr:ankyrin repeat-containing protein BDA1-like [Vicia villosa]